jgi:hypothetical protein
MEIPFRVAESAAIQGCAGRIIQLPGSMGQDDIAERAEKAGLWREDRVNW